MIQEQQIEKIIERCRFGDRQAQFELYNRYYKAMYHVALRFFPKEEEAEEMMQESFIKAFQKLDQYRGKSTFGAWLRRIVINTSIKALKKSKPDFCSLETLEPVNTIAEEPEAFDGITGEMVEREIGNLPDGYRVILTLYLVEGYDHEEIGEKLGIAPSTSRSQYSRAKNKLKGMLQKQMYV